MRLQMLVALAIGVASTPTMACNDNLFRVSGWQASAAQDGDYIRTEASAQLKYLGNTGYRMIHGAVLFSDALGSALVTVPLQRDAVVAPGDSIEASGKFVGRDSRITTINRDDVEYRTCVWSIIYEDGTTETFK